MWWRERTFSSHLSRASRFVGILIWIMQSNMPFQANLKQSKEGYKLETFYISPPLKESPAGWLYPKVIAWLTSQWFSCAGFTFKGMSKEFWQSFNQGIAWVKDFGLYQFYLDKVLNSWFPSILSLIIFRSWMIYLKAWLRVSPSPRVATAARNTQLTSGKGAFPGDLPDQVKRGQIWPWV